MRGNRVGEVPDCKTGMEERWGRLQTERTKSARPGSGRDPVFRQQPGADRGENPEAGRNSRRLGTTTGGRVQ